MKHITSSMSNVLDQPESSKHNTHPTMKTICLLIASVSIFSCTHIVFDVPQPKEGASLDAFPAEYLGTYAHADGERDSVVITSNSVTFIEYADKELALNALDTLPNISLKDGLLYDKEMPKSGGVPYTISDTIIQYGHVERFRVGLSDTLVLKRMKSYLVVSANFKDDNVNFWDVTLTKLTKGGDLIVHTVGNLKTPDSEGQSGEYDGNIDDFARFASYERIAEDTYLFRPTTKQFMKLVKKGFFSETELYRKTR